MKNRNIRPFAITVCILISAVTISVLGGCSQGKKESNETSESYSFVNTEIMTDDSGEMQTDENGRVMTEAVYAHPETVTDEDGNPVVNKDGKTVTTIVYIHQHNETLTDENGKAVQDGSGNKATKVVAVDDSGKKVSPAKENTKASGKAKSTTLNNNDSEVGQDLGDGV